MIIFDFSLLVMLHDWTVKFTDYASEQKILSIFRGNSERRKICGIDPEMQSIPIFVNVIKIFLDNF